MKASWISGETTVSTFDILCGPHLLCEDQSGSDEGAMGESLWRDGAKKQRLEGWRVLYDGRSPVFATS
jgi:hypothetical protein